MEKLIVALSLPALAYLVGSIPFGLLFTRLVQGVDIRKAGSGNIGATNVSRTVGKPWGLIVLTLDTAKGALPTWIAVSLCANGCSFIAAATAIAAICGHMFPLYLKFKASGKGVATAAGCFLIIAPVACTVSLLIFIAIARWSRRISAASLAATAALPPAIWFSTHDPSIVFSGIVAMVLIFNRHKANLQRLASGSEPPWS